MPDEPEASHCLPWCPICRGAEALGGFQQPGTRGQMAELQREAVLTARTVLDHYLERIDAATDVEPEVEEIPID